ncbi:MAG: M48 family metalloprotease, partial [Pseudonocardia sp.]|nr:M48 family metalloprotease [Pseudonocardia sp.]
IANTAFKAPPAHPPSSRLARGVQAVLIGLLPVPGLILARELRGVSVSGGAVASGPSRCPELCQTAAEFTEWMRLRRRPEIFMGHGYGRLTAFAGRASRYDYIVLPDELVTGPHRNNPGIPRFVLGHEMGHIRLHHASLWYRIALAYSDRIPLLGPALSRLREYSCDRYGAYLSAEGDSGLVGVASAESTEPDANADQPPRPQRRLWARFSELSRSHPSTARRLEQLHRAGFASRCPDARPASRASFL